MKATMANASLSLKRWLQLALRMYRSGLFLND